MEINTEEEFYAFTKKLFTENKITKEERDAMANQFVEFSTHLVTTQVLEKKI